MQLLSEGGNVFKDKDGQPLTQPINQSDVPATVMWLEQLTGLDFTTDIDPETNRSRRWLGSTGKTTTSGDLDLAVDLNDTTKEQLFAQLTQWAQSHGQDPKLWVKKGAEVHFRTPIAGDSKRGYAQTDFMFLSDLNWGIFYYSGGKDSAYKIMTRNALMSSIAKSLNLIVGRNGMFDRSNKKLAPGGLDPDTVAQALLGRKANKQDLMTVETIYAALAKDPNRETKLADFKEFLAREGLAEPQLTENDVGFLARLRDRIVNQGMHALIENIKLVEATNPRIPYIEDKVFDEGLKGAREALNIIKQTATDTKKYATVKWDGSPAVIFGRLQDGTFVLTDKGGLAAVGYQGLATSPDQIANIMSQRDQKAAASGNKADRAKILVPMYQELWPYLQAATPKNFRGLLKGDMLYSSTDPVTADAGNLVFQPNKNKGIVYRFPENSALGKKIKNSKIGIAVHTYMDEPTAPEQSVLDPESMLKPVSGLMVVGATVSTLENLQLDPKIMKELKEYTSGSNSKALQQLLNPQALRTSQITDLPELMKKYIMSLKGTDYSRATPAEFDTWLAQNVTARKYNNIKHYLNGPESNILGMNVAFDVWNKLHQAKIDLQRQLDLQQPGQEGWVFATPAGRAKIVSRTAGGFGARGR